VQKSELLRELQKEIQRHDLSTFVDEPPSVAQGGKGVVVPGCPSCRKRFGTISRFLDHLTNDVLPVFGFEYLRYADRDLLAAPTRPVSN
jgi:hypothetical protein